MYWQRILEFDLILGIVLKQCHGLKFKVGVKLIVSRPLGRYVYCSKEVRHVLSINVLFNLHCFLVDA
jgi:hypothetical protein